MNLENSIKDVITQKLEDGTVEKLVAEYLEKGVKNALDGLFRSYGDVTKVIEEKVKSVMIPYLENYNYSQYITKLDSILVDVLKGSALENKKLLENFKELMISEERKVIKVSELFSMWKDYVSKNVDTSDLEVVYDDGVSYQNVDVRLDVDYNEERSWSSLEHAVLAFECEQDEKMNFEIPISRWKDRKEKTWDINFNGTYDLKSIRRLDDFTIQLMKLSQAYTEVELDTDYESDDVEVEAEPEASFS